MNGQSTNGFWLDLSQNNVGIKGNVYDEKEESKYFNDAIFTNSDDLSIIK